MNLLKTSLLLALCLGSTFKVTAATYDAAPDFSISSNPNGVWSYGYTTTLGGTLKPFVDSGTIASQGIYWRSNIVAGAPGEFRNTNDFPLAFGTSLYPAGALSLHPGPNGELCVVRFTAPTSGQYQVESFFVGLDLQGTTTGVHVLTNGVPIFDDSINGYGPSTQTGINRTVSLLAGDTMDFVADRGNNDFGRDTTQISAHIEAPSNPPTVLGLASLSVPCSTPIELGVNVGSPDGRALSVVWTVNGTPDQTNSIPASSPGASTKVTFGSTFPSGSNVVAVSVSDDITTVSSSVEVNVVDHSAPLFYSLTADPSYLMVDNKMHPVALSAVISDCSAVEWKIVSIAINDPARKGGKTGNDAIITGDHTVSVRGERSSNQPRTYSITAEATDSSGNKSQRVTTVLVR